MRIALRAAAWLALAACGLGAQTAAPPPSPAPAAPAAPKAISRGYDTITLGMPYQTAYDAMVANAGIDYRGTPDVSMSPDREEKIVETRGGRYIKRGIFQFRDDKLFSITLELNPDQLDYYTLYTTFCARYGEAKRLSPQECVWEDRAVRLILEKPLSLKYIDVAVMDGLRQAAGIEESAQEKSRSAFIDRL